MTVAHAVRPCYLPSQEDASNPAQPVKPYRPHDQESRSHAKSREVVAGDLEALRKSEGMQRGHEDRRDQEEHDQGRQGRHGGARVVVGQPHTAATLHHHTVTPFHTATQHQLTHKADQAHAQEQCDPTSDRTTRPARPMPLRP